MRLFQGGYLDATPLYGRVFRFSRTFKPAGLYLLKRYVSLAGG